jgi:hypothetical protein
MVVDLNDKAFNDAKENDIFIIEEKNGKKFAKPVSRFELFEAQFKQLEECQKKCIEFVEIVKKQDEKIDELKNFINEKLTLIAKIVGGYDDNKE